MSINSAMLAGVSGLIANSSALAAISDNIANVNTVGYKRNQVNFTDIVTSQSLRGRYSAGGVQGVTTQYISQQGLLQTSNSGTDIGISGDGFFVVTEKATNLQPADARAFTRAGAFHVDADGYLVNNAGFYLQGWQADSTGAVNANPSDLNRLSSINVTNIGATVVPSSLIQITANLDATTVPSTPSPAYNAVTNSMSMYDATLGTGVKPDFAIQMNVVDTQGGSHTVSIAFRATSTANTWDAEIYGDPSEISTGAGLAPGQIRAGSVVFNQDGSLNLASSTLFSVPASPNIQIAASGTTVPPAVQAAGTAEWNSNLGISGQSIDFNLASIAGGLTQLAAASTVKTVTSNGGVGQVTGIEIGDDGFVSALFDNGEIRKLAQVAIATFLNPDGLASISGNAYRPSTASGDFSLKKPGEGGAGDIVASSLEASTVDLSAEFTGLITTQRAYSASSKIIMTADQMMEELINIKR